MRVGVVGWPVEHSRSPVIFAHWFERHGIAASYERIPVAPDEADAFFAALPERYAGVNVTAPHKEVAARCVRRTGVAERLGTVNTVWREGETLCGTSSDGEGFIASLDQAHPAWRDDNRDVLLFGSGGAAIAIAHALSVEGAGVTVCARSIEKARRIYDLLDADGYEQGVMPWTSMAHALPHHTMAVNATTLGMSGAPPLPADVALLPDGALVVDVVYNPLQTPLIAAARARGLATVDGLGMLLHQARVGFERWFGVRPEVDATLRAKVEATL